MALLPQNADEGEGEYLDSTLTPCWQAGNPLPPAGEGK